MIGVVQGPAFTADRYAYISFVGLFIMVSWGVADLLSNPALPAQTAAPIAQLRKNWVVTGRRHLGRATPSWYLFVDRGRAAVLLALTVIAHHQVGYWENEITVWFHNLRVTTDDWFVESRAWHRPEDHRSADRGQVALRAGLWLLSQTIPMPT